MLDDDRILGTPGDDVLSRTARRDLFLIGQGHDSIVGLAGLDRFQFLPSTLGPVAQNSVSFTDFAPAEGERLGLSRIDAIAGTAGELRWQDQDGQRLVQGDVNGDAVADLTIFLASPGPVQAGWFLL